MTDSPVLTRDEAPIWRLYLLRITYLMLVLMVGPMIWPNLIGHTGSWTVMRTVALCLLATISVLAAVGVLQPLRMVPLLLLDLLWKILWLAFVALPMWRAGGIDPDFADTTRSCLLGLVVFPIAIPWTRVWRDYVRRPLPRWV